MERRRKSSEMPTGTADQLTVEIGHRSRILIADDVAARVIEEFRPYLERAATAGKAGEGIQVLSVKEVAARLGKTERQLPRLEDLGDLPRRRQISCRRIGFLSHELDGLPADAVKVRDHRRINREQLAAKLGLDRKTISAMVKRGELPPKIDARHWYERDIDEWLLTRPLA